MPVKAVGKKIVEKSTGKVVGLRALVMNFGNQVALIEGGLEMILNAEGESGGKIGDGALAVEGLLAAAQCLGLNGGEPGAFFTGKEMVAVAVKPTPTLAIHRCGAADLEGGAEIVVVLQQYLGGYQMAAAVEAGDDLIGMMPVQAGGRAIEQGLSLGEGGMGDPGVREDDLFAAFTLFEEVVDPLPLAPAGNELQVALSVLAYILPGCVGGLQAQLKIQCRQAGVPAAVRNDLRNGFIEEHLVVMG